MSFGALVVLGCRVEPDGTPGPAALRRLTRAAEAHDEHRVPVLLSGGRSWAGMVEATAFRSWLVNQGGVPETLTWIECCSLSTAENARCSARILAEQHVRRVGLVTCDWHLPRALRAFRRAGLEAVPVPAPSPRTVFLRRWARALRERAAGPLDTWRTWGWEVP
ncbi:MAG TPA: YdcF family protein [Polyangiaceae bacterium]|nr:YdcF family protein [Polyangiaceae bacterium]